MAIRTKERTSCYVGQVHSRNKALGATFRHELERWGLTRYRWKDKALPKGIKMMTPTQWRKLQGFANYVYLDYDSDNKFSFLEHVTDTQFVNSVTMPVIEEMVRFFSFAWKSTANQLKLLEALYHDK